MEKVGFFMADMGGTDIATPLQNIISNKSSKNPNLMKRVFCLTDGEVFNPEQVIELCAH